MFNNYKITDKLFDKINSKIFFVFIIFSLFCTLPIFITDVMSNDLSFHINRINDIAYNLKDGILLTAPSANNIVGWGYQVSGFYPSLFLYPFSMLVAFLNIDVLYTFYIMVFCFNLLTITISFYCMKKQSNKKAAFYFSICCLLNPFRIFQIFLYGFVGTFTAITFIPLIFTGCYLLKKENNWKILMFGMTAILYCHLITFIFCVIFVFAYIIIFYKDFLDKSKILSLIKASIFSFIMSLGFLAPFFINYNSNIYKVNYNKEKLGIMTNIINYNIDTLFAIIFQIIYTYILFKLFIFLKNKINNYILAYSIPMFLWGAVAITPLFPWEIIEHIPFLDKIQFSNRILVIFIFYIIFILVDLMLAVKDFNYVIISLLMAFTLFPSTVLSYIQDKNTEINMKTYEDYRYIKNAESGTYFDIIGGEYIPVEFSINNKFVSDILLEDLVKYKVPEFSKETVYSCNRKNLKTTIKLETEKKTDVIVPLIYYKNYKAYNNGKELEIEQKDGKIFVQNVSSGVLTIVYKVPNIERVAVFCSLTCFIIIIFKKKTNHEG